MDGSLGKRALNLLRGAMGGAVPRPAREPAAEHDVLEQAVQQAAAANGHVAASSLATDPERDESGPDAQQALRRELEASLALIFISAADAIVTVDEGQRIMMFNRAAEQLFGCPAGEALGVCISRFIPEPLLTPDPKCERRFAETGVAGWRLGEVEPLTARRPDGQSL